MKRDLDEQIEAALKQRAVMQPPPNFTQAVMLRVMEDRSRVWLNELNAAATVLIVLGLSLSGSPARLGDWLGAGVDLLQRGGTAMGMIAGVNPPAPLVLAALAVWVAGLLVSDWMELVD
jgi:hypothetical protein